MPLNFFDLCIIQAMSNPDASDADSGETARKKWATRVVQRAQALDAARQAVEEKAAENESDLVNEELTTRSAIS